MRIIAGRHKGLRLTSVGNGDPAARLRPTPDRVRESLFSILAARSLPNEKTRVLDLFAGTGALGLEALSRGAAHVTFVEVGRPAQKLIAANVAKVGREANTNLLKLDATRLPSATAEPFDLVFLDPPYGSDLGQRALRSARDWLAPDALVVWEDDCSHDPPEGYVPDNDRGFGTTHITFLRRASQRLP
ncbi:16S rRNA (guanine(966)-N(2))-methyltransferase RsmD [Aestuariibius sp. 2305UL40-4]|uniref:16S rRNA (guanine(966)-N(2))-methyltransferase RsmD n=1 Tax=Aestuariibius violaceus TaxID=3234132 RepID=UPI00345E58BC